MPKCAVHGCPGAAATYGSGDYVRENLCPGCYHAWFTAIRRLEDARAYAERAAQELKSPHATPPASASSPTWRTGRNVKVREKDCSRCGYLIDIRKNAEGKHYPAEHGSKYAHRCPAASSSRSSPPAAVQAK